MTNRPGPLDGIRVLELGTMYAAPTTGRMLRDFGAEVTKVEDPKTGDYARQWSPHKNGIALGFARINAGKRSIAVDLRTGEGQQLIRRLAGVVDVVIESFRPGRMAEWGLDYTALRQLRPELILTHMSGFGQTGPYRERPGFGTVAETASGFAYVNGWPDSPPTSPPFGYADSIAGIAAAMATAMALYRRAVSGVGEEIDVALYEPLLFITGDTILKYTALHEIQGRVGNDTGSAAPRGIYQAGDGNWLSIAASNQVIARRLFAAMGEPDLIDDPRFATNAARLANNDAIQQRLSAWLASRTRDEALRELESHEVVCSPVNNARDIVADPHFRQRSLAELADPDLPDGVLSPGPVAHLAGYQGPRYDGVPRIGEHSRLVLREWLHVDDAEFAQLASAGVVRQG